MSAADRMGDEGCPERSTEPRDDRTGFERGAIQHCLCGLPVVLLGKCQWCLHGLPQCKGLYGRPCAGRVLVPGEHCDSCNDFIGGLGTGGT